MHIKKSYKRYQVIRTEYCKIKGRGVQKFLGSFRIGGQPGLQLLKKLSDDEKQKLENFVSNSHSELKSEKLKSCFEIYLDSMRTLLKSIDEESQNFSKNHVIELGVEEAKEFFGNSYSIEHYLKKRGYPRYKFKVKRQGAQSLCDDKPLFPELESTNS